MNEMVRSPRAGGPRTRHVLVLAALTAALFAGAASAAPHDHAVAPRFALEGSDRSTSVPRVAIAADAAVAGVRSTAHPADLSGAGRKEIREFAECFVLGMGLGRVLVTLIGGFYGALLAAGAAVRCI